MIKIEKKTISDQIVEHFKALIEGGSLKPGDEFPSERELEKELSVSRKTINKAVSVLAGMGYLFKEQGKVTYVADFRKRLELAGGERNIGFLFPAPEDIYHPSCAPLFRELCLLFRGYGLQLLFESSCRFENVRRRLEQEEIAGLIGFHTEWDFSRAELHVPLVMTECQPRRLRNPQADYVYADVVGAAREAVDYLVEAGHQDIAFLYGMGEGAMDRERIGSFREGLKAHGLACRRNRVLPSNYERKMTVENLGRMLERPPTALVCADDMVARFAVEELKRRGVRVPEDLSVVGFNDMEMYSLETPKLTTFKLPVKNLAAVIFQLFQDRLENPGRPGLEKALPMELVKRDTVALRS